MGSVNVSLDNYVWSNHSCFSVMVSQIGIPLFLPGESPVFIKTPTSALENYLSACGVHVCRGDVGVPLWVEGRPSLLRGTPRCNVSVLFTLSFVLTYSFHYLALQGLLLSISYPDYHSATASK
jgi:hypothetical protein